MKELIVDSFAGGGGASLGITLALGRGPDVAINHDAAAIAMHEANHPETRHFLEDVWKLSPHVVTKGRPVGLLWASPDCKHFSRAKGAKPVEKRIRSLAWVVVAWASKVKPRVIILENVREFADWGPLVPQWTCGCGWKGTEGQAILARTRRRCPRCNSLSLKIDYETTVPDPDRKGLTFKRFLGRLKGLGYKVEWRTLNAADYGAPTHRRRLFLVARCDGKPIVWPEPTHGDPKKVGEPSLFAPLQPWRTAAECIDWTIPCPSIFERKRPLADATMRRIALGIKRYVLDNAKPFIVRLSHTQDTFRGQGPDEPLPTMTGSREFAMVNPVVVGVGGRMGQTPAASVDAPSNTVTAKNDRAVVCPIVARIGQTNGNGKYANGPDEPLTTLTSKAEHLLVAPMLAGVGGAARAGEPASVEKPSSTVLPKDSRALVAAFLAKHYGGFENRSGVPANVPLPTTTTRGTQTQLVTANIIRMNYGEKQWNGVDEPLPTVTSANHAGLVAANLVRFNHDDAGVPVDSPLPTIATNNHAALVYSFLVKYFGTAVGQAADTPLHTATGKDRFGLVTVAIDGQPFVIVDIGMRMLTPRELARAQGFPDSYLLTGTNTSQVARIGNSVSPPMARVLVEANYTPRRVRAAATV